jgi:hypothetical protein
MIYLASPYTHKDPDVAQRRYELVTKVAGWLMRPDCHLGRYVVFSPITHSHPVAELDAGPYFDWAFWKYQDFELIRRCDEFWILRIPGWRESTGVTDELEFATNLGMNIEYVYTCHLPKDLQTLAEKL